MQHFLVNNMTVRSQIVLRVNHSRRPIVSYILCPSFSIVLSCLDIHSLTAFLAYFRSSASTQQISHFSSWKSYFTGQIFLSIFSFLIWKESFPPRDHPKLRGSLHSRMPLPHVPVIFVAGYQVSLTCSFWLPPNLYVLLFYFFFFL